MPNLPDIFKRRNIIDLMDIKKYMSSRDVTKYEYIIQINGNKDTKTRHCQAGGCVSRPRHTKERLRPKTD